MRDTIIEFLSFITMIESIVPREKNNENLGSTVEEALESLTQIFNPEVAKTSGKRMEIIRNDILEDRVFRSSSSYAMPKLWKLIDLWMERFRKSLWEKIQEERNNLNTCKAFFNTIFIYSIEKLSSELINY
jgi:hypothetical protein